MELRLLFKRLLMAILFLGIVSSFIGLSYAYFDTLTDTKNETITLGEWRDSCPNYITTPQEFYDFATSSISSPSDVYCLGNDIDFTGFNWVYSSVFDSNQFQGTLDGAGYTISNITFTLADVNSVNVSLFANINGGIIKNITIDTVSMGFTSTELNSTTMRTALLASTVSGTGNLVDNITLNNIEIIGDNASGIGGLFSYIQPNATLTLSNITGRGLHILNGNKYVGGLIGFIDAGSGTVTIHDIDFIGFVASNNSASNTGGLVGYVDNSTLNINRAIVEYTSSATVSLSNTSVSYTSTKQVGGLIGAMNRLASITTNDTFYTGTLYNDYRYVGALAGDNRNTITQSEAYYSQVFFVNTYTAPSEKNVIHGNVVNSSTMPNTSWWNTFSDDFYQANNLWTQDPVTGRLELIR